MDKFDYQIPFNKPFIVGKELYNIAQAVISYSGLSGDGIFTRRCQKWFEDTLGCAKSLLTHSGTAALEMSAILCDIQPGDEVIMPSYTFVSTANAFVLRGGVPVFVDVRPDTLNIDENRIKRAITKKTKAIVPVHYAGFSCAMDVIIPLAKAHRLRVIEDAAQALLSKSGEDYLGTIGDLGILSFHETKNVISGEGGALLINDNSLIERAEIIWEKGTDRKKFFRGEVDKYSWVDIGSSFLPGEMTAAFLHAQLEQASQINLKRRDVFDRYVEGLKPLAEKNKIKLPPEHFESDSYNGHMIYIITKSLKERSELIAHLRGNSVNAIFHFSPLHSSVAGKKYGRFEGEMKVTDMICDQILRLPLYYDMTLADVDKVVDLITDYYNTRG
jgi:dTDP-4-amino-4,6-dideoxygalactose transaminase